MDTLKTDLADFLARRGEYEHDVDVWPTPANPAKPLVGADLGITPLPDADPKLDSPGRRALGAFLREATLRGPDVPPAGVKHDAGKAPLSLLGMVTRALGLVSRVQEYGAQKYPSPDNWKRVPNGSQRYRDAALRHLFADIRGEAADPETGLSHLAHAACCLLIALEHDLGFEVAVDGVELAPLAPAPEGEPLPAWRFPPRR